MYEKLDLIKKRQKYNSKWQRRQANLKKFFSRARHKSGRSQTLAITLTKNFQRLKNARNEIRSDPAHTTSILVGEPTAMY